MTDSVALDAFSQAVSEIEAAFKKERYHASMSRYDDDLEQFQETAGSAAARLRTILDECINISDEEGLPKGIEIFAGGIGKMGIYGHRCGATVHRG